MNDQDEKGDKDRNLAFSNYINAIVESVDLASKSGLDNVDIVIGLLNQVCSISKFLTSNSSDWKTQIKSAIDDYDDYYTQINKE